MRRRKRTKADIQFARDQRQTANDFAREVWQMVRNRRCCGVKFRREYPVPPYTVDFCCVELKLVIEVDGKGHFTDEGIERDRIRDKFLNRLGYKVVRVPGYDVLSEPDKVWEKLCHTVLELGDS